MTERWISVCMITNFFRIAKRRRVAAILLPGTFMTWMTTAGAAAAATPCMLEIMTFDLQYLKEDDAGMLRFSTSRFSKLTAANKAMRRTTPSRMPWKPIPGAGGFAIRGVCP